MSLRARQATPAVELGQWLVAVRNGTHFAFPAEIVRGLGASDDLPPAAHGMPSADLMCHFPGTVVVGAPGREVLCGHESAQQVVLVDDIIGLTEISKEQIRPLPGQFTGPERHWFAGLFLFRDTIALMLNPEWLLVPGERLRSRSALLGPAAGTAEETGGLECPLPAADASSADPSTLDDVTLEEATDAEDTPWADL